jgi:hypothetical protein
MLSHFRDTFEIDTFGSLLELSVHFRNFRYTFGTFGHFRDFRSHFRDCFLTFGTLSAFRDILSVQGEKNTESPNTASITVKKIQEWLSSCYWSCFLGHGWVFNGWCFLFVYKSPEWRWFEKQLHFLVPVIFHGQLASCISNLMSVNNVWVIY